jgi:large subunit ribosomal protein L4
VIENLEKGLTDSKTKSFLEICKNCSVNLDQKVLIVVAEKTVPLKLATQNLQNVELILASNLNTFSLLNAKQILLTPLALTTIKEIYCD